MGVRAYGGVLDVRLARRHHETVSPPTQKRESSMDELEAPQFTLLTHSHNFSPSLFWSSGEKHLLRSTSTRYIAARIVCGLRLGLRGLKYLFGVPDGYEKLGLNHVHMLHQSISRLISRSLYISLP